MFSKRIHESSVQNSDIAYRIFREITLAPTLKNQLTKTEIFVDKTARLVVRKRNATLNAENHATFQ